MYLPSSTLLYTLTTDFVSQIFNLRYITYTCLMNSEEEKPRLIQRNTLLSQRGFSDLCLIVSTFPELC